MKCKTMKNKLLKSIAAVVILSTPALQLWAQGAAAPADIHHVERTLGNTVLVAGAIIIAFTIGVLLYLNNMLLQVQRVRYMDEHGIKVPEKVVVARKESWLETWYKRMTGTVPLEKEEDIMFDHAYDGIRELDNKLPPWWVAMFYISIAFAFVYFGYFHLSGYGMGSKETYEAEMVEAKQAVKAYLASQAAQVDETNVTILEDEGAIALGKSIYTANCVACHGTNGEGGVGPNFSDAYWIHGGDIKDIFKTIKYGVPEKGMISWQAQLRPEDMQKVASYILGFQGTNPPNGKAPEGELYTPVQAAEQDSTGTQMSMVR